MKKRIAKWLLIGLLLFLAYAVLIEPYWIRVEAVWVRDPNFVEFFKQYKSILISDIHVSRLGIREKILLAGFRALGKMGSGSLNSAETIDSDTAKAILRIPELGG